MIRNYYTLQKLTDELQLLCGSIAIECFTQEKDVLVIHFYNGTESFFLQFSTDTLYGSLILKSGFARARSNSSDLFPNLSGKKLISLKIQENDRVIELGFADLELKFYFFGGAGNCAVLTDNRNEIIDSFKLSSTVSTKLNALKIELLTEFEKYSSIQDLILKENSKLGKYYSLEICRKLNIDPSVLLNNSDNDKKNQILNEINDFESILIGSKKFFILRNNSGKNILSLIRLTDYPEVVQMFDTLNKAISYYIGTNLRDNSVYNLKKSIRARIEKIADKLSKKLLSYNELSSSLERAEKYYLFGSLLSSRPDVKSKSGKSIELTDWDENLITIPLKEELNLLDNSIRYFEKSKNIHKTLENNQKQRPQLEIKLNKINLLQNRLENAMNVKEINRIMDENRDLTGFSQNEEPETASKFRKFDLGEGFVLYVGKNAANNDELTMHFAKPNDLWFHSRGSSGSHAVLRLNKDQRPPKQILQKAAAITAYYSGSKKSKWTPVAYTFKKYVHKPKGANPGSVVISREEVIMAEPKLPEIEIQ